MAREIGPDPAAQAPDQAARARAKPFRLVQAVCVGDAVAGVFVHYRAPHWNVPGEVLGMPVLEFVGLALIVIGASGYVLFEFLARAAMRRTAPPPPLG
jgi:hypothetical protein